VSFFPQLVAGPIERASHLLPQFRKPRTLARADLRYGLWLIAWGLYQKMVVADNMARLVDATFAPYAAATTMTPVPEDGLRLLVVIYAFAIQIYCDFAGYTDIARGTARLLGFEIMLNFNLPYVARNPSDFWHRWHISLSTWLRDYLYIPLGGNRHGTFQTYRNLMLTMLLGGLWHGAAWTFVLWGAFHGFILVVYRGLSASWERWALAWKEIRSRAGFGRTRVATQTESAEPFEVDPVSSRQKEKSVSLWRPIYGGGRFFRTAALRDRQSGQPLESTNSVAEREDRNLYLTSGVTIVQILIMFHLVCLGWLLFRAQNLATVSVFLRSIFLRPHWSPEAAEALWRLVFYGWFLVSFDLLRAWKGTLKPFEGWPWFARLNIWVFVMMSLLALAARGGHEFIYFAF
jgi:D-alanyl-lipoteichoic acid acyltransferase DltB (MBOAT superfamily)